MKLVNAEGSELLAYLFNGMTTQEKMDVPKDKRDRISKFMVANGYRFVFGRWYLQADPIKEEA
jgi:hypothetical protein